MKYETEYESDKELEKLSSNEIGRRIADGTGSFPPEVAILLGIFMLAVFLAAWSGL
jgi:hypothetical protein